MFEKLTSWISDKKNRDLALVAGGMVGIMSGAKLTPISMFATGFKGLEEEWRKAHPEFDGDLKERWQLAIDFYDSTHQDPTNRVLHTVGIPMIVAGAAGMLVSPRYTPPWWISNGSWTAGWVLNFIGHGMFEKSAPAFAEDPLSFLAGPVWDFTRLKDRFVGRGDAPVDVPPAPRAVSVAAA